LRVCAHGLKGRVFSARVYLTAARLSTKAEVQFVIVQPGHSGIDFVVAELLGKVFVIGAQTVGVGCIVVRNDDRVVSDWDVSFQTEEEVLGEVVSIPRRERLTQASA